MIKQREGWRDNESYGLVGNHQVKDLLRTEKMLIEANHGVGRCN